MASQLKQMSDQLRRQSSARNNELLHAAENCVHCDVLFLYTQNQYTASSKSGSALQLRHSSIHKTSAS